MPTTYNYISANRWRSIVLILVVSGLILVMGWVFDQAFESQGVIVLFAVIWSLIVTLTGYYAGDKIALAMAGARRVTKEQAPYVVRLVENLAITAGLPMPKVYVIDDPTINAFATGRHPRQASVAVTTGAIEQLENEELEGVLAHELSHIKNFDVRFLTLVAVLVGVVVILADLFWRGHWLGMGNRRSRSGGAGLFVLIGVLLMIFAPLIAQLIKLAVSRRREFLADASGALVTRYPEGLARALEKIETVNQTPMRRTSEAIAHLFIANPFGRSGRGLGHLFSTHPPIAERVKALREMGSVRA